MILGGKARLCSTMLFTATEIERIGNGIAASGNNAIVCTTLP